MVKRPRDFNQLAKLVVDIASGEVPDPVSESKRHPSVRGRAGGIKGGVVRAQNLSAAKRSEIATHAAKSRWNKSPYGGDSD